MRQVGLSAIQIPNSNPGAIYRALPQIINGNDSTGRLARASRWALLETTTGARLVSSRSGDASKGALDRSETIGACGHPAEWDTPRSVGNGAPVNGLVVASRRGPS